ncbi:transcriptional regulator Myc-B-like [Limulus polyphemus]|uniref:Transcriptional regulator Myc-B-like n=1 Tax=Limulus polyphemus TaxID=6850 RepID=A0ABM1C027_LIMPO|nr:transcriptional regulator Myc-B-like [Limulus polyphemus]
MGTQDIFSRGCLDSCVIPSFTSEVFDYLSSDSEFYNTPAPSENIWKKFDLPTPPRSPEHVLSGDVFCHHPFSPCERLQRVSDLLDIDFLPSQDFDSYFGGFSSWSGLVDSKVKDGLKVELIHDCMWSGRCTEDCKQKDRPFQDFSFQPLNHTVTPYYDSVTEDNSLDDCTDVPPSDSGPLRNDHCYYQRHCQNHDKDIKGTKFHHSTPASGLDHLESDSPSDSEIDVVTVDNSLSSCRKKGNRSFKESNENTCFTPKVLSYSVQNGKLVAQKTLKRLVSSDSSSDIGKRKIRRTENKKFDGIYSKSRSSRSWGSRSSSDSDDPIRIRKEHNNMERKRRDDLRFAFQTLRENVPDIMENSKAPKVMILKKATTYLQQLTNAGLLLERSLKAESRKKLELQRKLQQLQKNSSRNFRRS